MQNSSFLKGMGMGLAIGASVGMALAPKRKNTNVVGKARGRRGACGEHHGRDDEIIAKKAQKRLAKPEALC